MASGAAGAAIKRKINAAIHPPIDDAEAILAAADRVYLELPFLPRPDARPAARGLAATRRTLVPE